ncbi:MAG TPA: methyltransferase domain-containing protein [Rhizobiales bacterium]|nr:16S ribosomal RNA methyltransferase KsgA/Dim1 family protein [bacterium BMS3Bbin10]HDO52198.1 methyltransferase domain-containing protein [Hyphomicrobiales bacterium]
MIRPDRNDETPDKKIFPGHTLESLEMRQPDDTSPNDYRVFFRAWLSKPLRTGASVPSSRALSEAMAAAAAPAPSAKIVELGPGTGTVTQALLDAGVREENLTLIELNDEFRDLLKKRFPRAEILAEDAFSAITRLMQTKERDVSAVVSSLPLTLYPKEKRIRLRDEALRLTGPNGRLVQFTYSPISPMPHDPAVIAHCSRRIWTNLPPAAVWCYRARLDTP